MGLSGFDKAIGFCGWVALLALVFLAGCVIHAMYSWAAEWLEERAAASEDPHELAVREEWL